MATPTYDALASTTLASSASSVTFSSLDTIAAGYRDLVLVCNYTHTANTNSRLKVNGSSTGYSGVWMAGTGSAANSGPGGGAGAYVELEVYQPQIGNKAQAMISLFDFSVTDKHKSLLLRVDNSARATEASAWRWGNTSAITSVSIEVPSGAYDTGSVFSLFGIVA